MSRDYRKLKVFALADEAVLRIYRVSRGFPSEERFGLQAQLRRAAVSVPANIVEGSARRSTPDFLNFLNIAAGSASETQYLLTLSSRLGYMDRGVAGQLDAAYQAICAGCQALITALERLEQRTAGTSTRRSRSAKASGPETRDPRPET